MNSLKYSGYVGMSTMAKWNVFDAEIFPETRKNHEFVGMKERPHGLSIAVSKASWADVGLGTLKASDRGFLPNRSGPAVCQLCQ